MVRTVEQIMFVLAHRGKTIRKLRIDIDMARRARAASAAQCEHFVDPSVAQDLHHAQAVLTLDLGFDARPVADSYLWQ